MSLENDFNYYALTHLERFRSQSEVAVLEAAQIISERLKSGARFLVAGTGHSHMIAEELYTRAGGLACVTPILPAEFQLFEHPLKSTEVERLETYAGVIMKLYGISAGDAILVASNSGRNAMTVELARLAKEAGAAVIVFTSVSRPEGERSRHSSGLFLKDFADVIIDSCTPPGDAAFNVPGVDAGMGAVSSFIGVYMAQLLSIQIARLLASDGQRPPVFMSSNADGGDEWNKELFRRYLGV